MATWNQVKDFIKGIGPILSEEENSIFLEYKVSENRSQQLLVTLTNHKDLGEWVMILSAIGEIPSSKLEDAISGLNYIPIGGIMKSGSMYYLRDSMRLAEITSDRLLEEMKLILIAADALENALVGGDKH
jgi:hypothetical protein